MTIPVVLGASNSDTGAPIVGIELTTGYRATPRSATTSIRRSAARAQA